MKLMFTLALRNLKQNKKRSLFTIIGIVLSVAMITAVSGFVFSARDALQSILKESIGNWHVEVTDLSNEQADTIIKDKDVSSGYTKEEGGNITVYIRLKKPGKSLELGQKIADRNGIKDKPIKYNLELLAAEGYMISTFVAVLYAIGVLLGLIIVIGSVIVIANAFSISTGERVKQFGILKSTGATSEQIRLSVLFEGVILSMLGIPLGILMGLGLQYTGITIADTLAGSIGDTNVVGVRLRMVIIPVMLLIAVVTSFITVLLSAWFPARKASKISAIDAIRLSDEVKIVPGRMRTSRLTKRLFGFEGMLAAKSLKRSRRKYRATVISLVVSIVFVLISTSFGGMLFQVLSMIYPDIDATAMVRTNAAISIETASEYTDAMSGYKNADSVMVGTSEIGAEKNIETEKNKDIYTAEALKYWNGEIPDKINLICVDADTYHEACKQADVASGSGILINYSLTHTSAGRIEFAPIHFTPYTQNLLSDGKTRMALSVDGQITKPSPLIKQAAGQNKVSILVPMDFIQKKKLTSTVSWFVNVSDASGFLHYADARLDKFKGLYVTSNVKAESNMIHNIYLLVMIFVYGFIGLLSLIGITSVISTISTNIRLRAQEFAVIRSVGMTPEGLRKMLNLESFLYGLKSLLIGVPLGLLLSYGLYRVFALVIGFNFTIPWLAVLFCILAVFALTFMTMHYAARQLKNNNIIETMRMTNV